MCYLCSWSTTRKEGKTGRSDSTNYLSRVYHTGGIDRQINQLLNIIIIAKLCKILHKRRRTKCLNTAFEPNKQTSDSVVNKYQPTLRRSYSHSHVTLSFSELYYKGLILFFTLQTYRILMSAITPREVNVQFNILYKKEQRLLYVQYI